MPPHPPWVAEATVSALVRVLGGANADGQKEATRSLRALGRRHGSALTNGMRAAVARRVIGVGCMRARLEFLRRAAVEQMGGYCSESDDAESASSDTDSDGDSDSDSEASTAAAVSAPRFCSHCTCCTRSGAVRAPAPAMRPLPQAVA